MRRMRSEGFTLVEVILTFSILAVATVALGLVELSNAQRSQELKARDIAFARAQAFMERLLRMPFGAPNPPALTGTELDRLFGSDDDVFGGDPNIRIQLTQLVRRDLDADGIIDEPPITFTLQGVEDAGQWQVFVDVDLDGTGTVEPVVAGQDTREGRTDLLRIEFRRNGRTVLRTLRARTPQERDAEDFG